MNWRTHAKIISGLVVVALAGGGWYLTTPAQSEVDIAKLYGPTPDLSKAQPETFPSVVIEYPPIPSLLSGTPVPLALSHCLSPPGVSHLNVAKDRRRRGGLSWQQEDSQDDSQV